MKYKKGDLVYIDGCDHDHKHGACLALVVDKRNSECSECTGDYYIRKQCLPKEYTRLRHAYQILGYATTIKDILK